MAVPMPADRDPAIIDAAQRLRPAPVPRPLQLLVQLALDHGLDKAAHPITHRGFNRIEPIIEKIHRCIGERLRGIRLRGNALHGVVSYPTSVMVATTARARVPRKPFYTHLYVQVLIAIAIGILLGHFYPSLGEQMKPLGDGFIKLIKMMIAPIIFCTVVHGIASMEDMKKVGRVGLKALIYFEVTTTLALILGLVVVNVLQPGAGMNVDPRSIDTRSIQVYTTKAGQQSTVEFLMHIIPNTVIGAFAEGEILQVLFFAILFAFGLHMMGERGRPVIALINAVSHGLFNVVGIIMRAAPIGAFGAMAFTIGKYGIATLLSLGKLMAAFYLTCLLF